MNPFTEAREHLATILEDLGWTVDRTQPAIISPGRIVVQQGDYVPADRFGFLDSTVELDVIVERHASFHETQTAIDEALTEILPAILNNTQAEISRISPPFNVVDTEGTMLPASTITLTQEIKL